MPSIPLKAEAQAGRARPHARPEAENRHGDRTPRPWGGAERTPQKPSKGRPPDAAPGKPPARDSPFT